MQRTRLVGMDVDVEVAVEPMDVTAAADDMEPMVGCCGCICCSCVMECGAELVSSALQDGHCTIDCTALNDTAELQNGHDANVAPDMTRRGGERVESGREGGRDGEKTGATVRAGRQRRLK